MVDNHRRPQLLRPATCFYRGYSQTDSRTGSVLRLLKPWVIWVLFIAVRMDDRIHTLVYEVIKQGSRSVLRSVEQIQFMAKSCSLFVFRVARSR